MSASPDTTVKLCGLTLKNPVITASGTFGFGREYDGIYDIGQLGGISVKGLTLYPREGNPPPRIAETPSGMLNSVGLQNPGVDAFILDELPWLLTKGTIIIANIAGSTPEEYIRIAQKLSETKVHMIELNISCPNVDHGGMAFGACPSSIESVNRTARPHSRQPVMVKLTPNVSDIAECAKAAEEGGADVVSLINTLLGMAIDVKTRKPVLANITGGLSGPAIRPVALRMVYAVSRAVSIPVVGMGGIVCAEDVIAFMLAGATAVQVGTASISEPTACLDIINRLKKYLKDNGIESIDGIISKLEV
jgi:dihydroorotate dehydrogenase (NAD+) catalytic subunit